MITFGFTLLTINVCLISEISLLEIFECQFFPITEFTIITLSISTKGVNHLPTFSFTSSEKTKLAFLLANFTLSLIFFFFLLFIFFIFTAYLAVLSRFFFDFTHVDELAKGVIISFLESFFFTKNHEKIILTQKTVSIVFITNLTIRTKKVFFYRLFGVHTFHMYSLSTFCAVNNRIVTRSFTGETNHTIRFNKLS